jgi:Flp pilus assembly protein TadG
MSDGPIMARSTFPALHQRGAALLEFALVLPALLLLAFGTYDLSRAIDTEMILVNISREGADLMSRSADSASYAQLVMNALGDTAKPNYQESPGSSGWKSAGTFENNSQILITRIKGVASGSKVNATITEQYHWLRGSIAPTSQIWNCGNHWNADGSCTIPSPAPVVILGNLGSGDVLNDGDTFYAVEVFYDYSALFGGMNVGAGLVVPTVGPTMYAWAIF